MLQYIHDSIDVDEPSPFKPIWKVLLFMASSSTSHVHFSKTLQGSNSESTDETVMSPPKAMPLKGNDIEDDDDDAAPEAVSFNSTRQFAKSLARQEKDRVSKCVI